MSAAGFRVEAVENAFESACGRASKQQHVRLPAVACGHGYGGPNESFHFDELSANQYAAELQSMHILAAYRLSTVAETQQIDRVSHSLCL